MIDGHDPLRRAVLAAAVAGTAGWLLSACTASSTLPTAAVAGPVARGLAARKALVIPTSPGTRAAGQVVLPEVPISSRLHARYSSPGGLSEAFDRQLLVLSYHDVRVDGHRSGLPGEDRYTVFAADFAAQMQMLHLAGFRTVGIAEVLAARRAGRALPRRSVLITFDDGGSGQWTYADKVLARYGFRAVAFVITSFVGRPSYVGWAEVEQMQRSGRWDVQDHTHADHHLVPRGRGLTNASVLVNRRFDPTSGTLESLGAAQTRVRDDLRTSIELFSNHGIARPTAFAYPYSQVEGPTNDPRFAAYVRDLLATSFPLLFTNAAPGRLVSPRELASGLLPRVEVTHGEAASALYDRLHFLADGRSNPPGSTGPRGWRGHTRSQG